MVQEKQIMIKNREVPKLWPKNASIILWVWLLWLREGHKILSIALRNAKLSSAMWFPPKQNKYCVDVFGASMVKQTLICFSLVMLWILTTHSSSGFDYKEATALYDSSYTEHLKKNKLEEVKEQKGTFALLEISCSFGAYSSKYICLWRFSYN